MTLGAFLTFAERYLEGGVENGGQLIDQVCSAPALASRPPLRLLPAASPCSARPHRLSCRRGRGGLLRWHGGACGLREVCVRVCAGRPDVRASSGRLSCRASLRAKCAFSWSATHPSVIHLLCFFPPPPLAPVSAACRLLPCILAGAPRQGPQAGRLLCHQAGVGATVRLPGCPRLSQAVSDRSLMARPTLRNSAQEAQGGRRVGHAQERGGIHQVRAQRQVRRHPPHVSPPRHARLGAVGSQQAESNSAQRAVPRRAQGARQAGAGAAAELVCVECSRCALTMGRVAVAGGNSAFDRLMHSFVDRDLHNLLPVLGMVSLVARARRPAASLLAFPP